jgi:hypothetical protein
MSSDATRCGAVQYDAPEAIDGWNAAGHMGAEFVAMAEGD